MEQQTGDLIEIIHLEGLKSLTLVKSEKCN